MARLSALYLLSYNSIQALGWALALFRLLTTKSLHGANATAGDLICLLQTASFLEVAHAAIGLVPSGALFSLLQWGGRTHFLLAIVRQIPEVQDQPSIFITFTAWSLSEVIRYPHYALSSIRSCPSWLTYLRYTAFIILYPIGVAPGEMYLIYQALPFIKERNLYANLFQKLSISYYYFVLALLICYPVLWLKLYLHLFKQRRYKLGRKEPKKRL